MIFHCLFDSVSYWLMGFQLLKGIKSSRWRSLVHSHWQQAKVSFINCDDLLQGGCLVWDFDCQPPYGVCVCVCVVGAQRHLPQRKSIYLSNLSMCWGLETNCRLFRISARNVRRSSYQLNFLLLPIVDVETLLPKFHKLQMPFQSDQKKTKKSPPPPSHPRQQEKSNSNPPQMRSAAIYQKTLNERNIILNAVPSVSSSQLSSHSERLHFRTRLGLDKPDKLIVLTGSERSAM